MPYITNQAIFIFFAAVTIYMFYLLAPMLTPFLLGALLAYLTDPLVKHLEKWHIPHLLSVVIVFAVIFGTFTLLIFMLAPLIQTQINALIESLPQIIVWLQETVIPKLSHYVNLDALKTAISSGATKSLSLSAVLSSGYTLIDWTVNIVLTPVVMFYLLRDWDVIIKSIKHALPKRSKSTLLTLAKECDEMLSAFFRGQLLVMLSLGIIYGVGLTIVGLRVGFIIGLIGGLLSIVPFLGSIFVVITACITASIQFGAWQPVLWVLVVYMIGQFAEGYILTPYLIGNRIGLHPVAIIFAVMAGGTLFGFFGILLALPVAALIMVFINFMKLRNIVLDEKLVNSALARK